MKKIKSAVAILLLPMCFLWGGCQNTSEPAMPQDFIGESPKGERLLEKESPYTICFLEESGKGTVYIFGSPVSFWNEEDQLTLIDNHLVSVSDKELKKSGYRYQNKQCDIGVYFPKDLTETPILIQNGEQNLKVSPVQDKKAFRSVKKESFQDKLDRSHDAVTYSDDENTKIQFIPTSSGVTASVTFFKKPASNTLEFSVAFPQDAVPQVVGSQYIAIKGQKNSSVQSILYPSYLEDETGKTSFQNQLSIQQEGDRYRYTIKLDQSFLDHSDIQYPVTITPSFELYRNKMADSTVYSGLPDQNAYLSNFTVMGTHPVYGESMEYLRFRLQYIVGTYSQNVESASLCLPNLMKNSPSLSLELYRLKDIWSSTGLTWRKKDKTYDLLSSTTMNQAGRNMLDITAFVKDSYDDDLWETETQGLALKAKDGSQGYQIYPTYDNALYQPYVKVVFKDMPPVFEHVTTINPDGGVQD